MIRNHAPRWNSMSLLPSVDILPIIWGSTVHNTCMYIHCSLFTCQFSLQPPPHTHTHRPGSRNSASIILRGANDFMVDEMERSVHDALCVVKRVLESNQVVPGGGAVEAALSIYLETFATSIVSIDILSLICICLHYNFMYVWTCIDLPTHQEPNENMYRPPGSNWQWLSLPTLSL